MALDSSEAIGQIEDVVIYKEEVGQANREGSAKITTVADMNKLMDKQ